MHERKTTILITSAGSQVGGGILDSLHGRRSRLRIVGTNSLTDAPTLYGCDVAWLLPPLAAGPRFEQAFAAVLQREQPALIIPGRDDDVPFLAAFRDRAGPDAPPVLTGPGWLAEVLRDKQAIADYASQHGLPFVATAATETLQTLDDASALARRWGWPLVVKPARGDGSRDIWLVNDEAALATWIGTPGFVIQPYLDADATLQQWLDGFRRGTPLHSSVPQLVQDVVQVLVGRLGTVIGCYGIRTDMKAGRSWRVVPNPDPALLALGQAFGEQLARDGWRGPLNIQTRRAAGRYVPFEVNGRFNGTSSSRTALGFDEVGLILRDFLGCELPAPALAASNSVVRQLVDRPLVTAAVETLRRDGVWSGPAVDAD